jgi:hypothetical protein
VRWERTEGAYTSWSGRGGVGGRAGSSSSFTGNTPRVQRLAERIGVDPSRRATASDLEKQATDGLGRRPGQPPAVRAGTGARGRGGGAGLRACRCVAGVLFVGRVGRAVRRQPVERVSVPSLRPDGPFRSFGAPVTAASAVGGRRVDDAMAVSQEGLAALLACAGRSLRTTDVRTPASDAGPLQVSTGSSSTDSQPRTWSRGTPRCPRAHLPARLRTASYPRTGRRGWTLCPG